MKPERKIRVKPSHGRGFLTPVQKGEALNPNGRPKNYLNDIKEALELECEITVNKSTVRSLMNMLAYLPRDKVLVILEDDKMPVAIRLFCKSIVRDWNLSSTDTVKGLISFEMGNAPPDPKNETPLSEIEPQKVLDTAKYLVAMLDMTLLETFCNWLEEHVDKKRAGEAKIINQ